MTGDVLILVADALRPAGRPRFTGDDFGVCASFALFCKTCKWATLLRRALISALSISSWASPGVGCAEAPERTGATLGALAGGAALAGLGGVCGDLSETFFFFLGGESSSSLADKRSRSEYPLHKFTRSSSSTSDGVEDPPSYSYGSVSISSSSD